MNALLAITVLGAFYLIQGILTIVVGGLAVVTGAINLEALSDGKVPPGLLLAVEALQIPALVGFSYAYGFDARSAIKKWAPARAWLWLSPLLILIVGTQLLSSLLTNDPIVANGTSLSEACILIGLAFAVGGAEELAFRGMIIDVLGGAARPVLAVVGSALLFGAAHIPDNPVNAAAVTLAVGVPFALMRLRGASLLTLAVAHGIIDTAALLYLGNLDLPDSTPSGEAIGQLIGATVICLGYVTWFVMTNPARQGSTAPEARSDHIKTPAQSNIDIY
jgi:membrane protease YdiL (CAAX protease family)